MGPEYLNHQPLPLHGVHYKELDGSLSQALWYKCGCPKAGVNLYAKHLPLVFFFFSKKCTGLSTLLYGAPSSVAPSTKSWRMHGMGCKLSMLLWSTGKTHQEEETASNAHTPGRWVPSLLARVDIREMGWVSSWSLGSSKFLIPTPYPASPPAPAPPRPMSQYYQRLGGNWMEFREEQQVRLKGLLGLRDWFMRQDEKNLMCAAWLSGYKIIACKYLTATNTEKERNSHRVRKLTQESWGKYNLVGGWAELAKDGRCGLLAVPCLSNAPGRQSDGFRERMFSLLQKHRTLKCYSIWKFNMRDHPDWSFIAQHWCF